MKKILLLSILFLSIFSSCKKDNDDEVSLKGKWTLENIVSKEYDNNVLVDTDTEPGAGTTLDFQNNSNVVITTLSGVETYTYTITGSNVTFDGDTYEIRNLTESSVIIYQRENFGTPGDYTEFFANMKR